MTQVRKGDNVKVHYTGSLADGTVFNSSVGREPLSVTVGSGQVIAGFDEALLGMMVGEKKTVLIPVDKAYGARNEEMVMEVPIEQVPPDLDAEVGSRLELGGMNGELIRVVVSAISKTHITLDANPPLAGKDLTFTIEVLDCTTP